MLNDAWHTNDIDIDASISHGAQVVEEPINQSTVDILILVGFQEEIARMTLKALGGDIKKATYVGKLPEGISYACNLSDYTALGFGSSYNQLIVERNVYYVFDMYYQVKNQHLWDCDFFDLALVSNENEFMANDDVLWQMDTLLEDTSLTTLLKSCFEFDTLFPIDVKRFGDGKLFNGNLRRLIKEVILILEKKLFDVVGKKVIVDTILHLS